MSTRTGDGVSPHTRSVLIGKLSREVEATERAARVSREQEMPKYQQIAADLRAAIVNGDYAPGARLPGENTLMSEYGVARMTARQALAALISEGLAVSRKGSGVFVREFRQIVRDGVNRLASAKWGQDSSI